MRDLRAFLTGFETSQRGETIFAGHARCCTGLVELADIDPSATPLSLPIRAVLIQLGRFVLRQHLDGAELESAQRLV